MSQSRQLVAMGALLFIGAVVAAHRWSGRDSMLNADYLAGLPDLGRERTFDGIDLPRLAAFWRSWKLVTVRYRKDNGEQRFVYANDIAWKAIRDGRARYPDGAMFGKIAFGTSDDAAFPNSAEPARFARLQLMLKDSKGHAESDGWAYAIIIGRGRPPYDSVQSTAAACHACHQAVPGRDYVFSTPAFGPGRQGSGSAFDSRFTSRETSTLSEAQRGALGYVVDPRDSRDFVSIREVGIAPVRGLSR